MAFASDKGRQGAAGVSTGFDIDNSLRFNDNDSAYLSRTPSSAGNRKTFTFSCWYKKSTNNAQQALFYTQTGGEHAVRFRDDDNSLDWFYYSGGYVWRLRTSALYRDTSAWYHIVAVFDTSNGTASERARLYINGERITSFQTETYPSQNAEQAINSTVAHHIGHFSTAYNDGYMSEVHFIDGTALDPTSFGETGTYGEWKPKEVTGLTYGTNGFYLDFKLSAATSSGLGNDANGSNNWTPNNLASTDQMVDTPTNNFATFNPLYTCSNHSLSEGNLKYTQVGSGTTSKSLSTIPLPSSGKWYVEINALKTSSSAHGNFFGITNMETQGATCNQNGFYGVYKSSGASLKTPTGDVSAYSLTISAGNILQIAWDADNRKLYLGNNNTYYAYDKGTDGNPTSGTNESFSVSDSYEYMVCVGHNSDNAGTGLFVINSGQDSSFAGNKTAQGNQDSNDIGDFYYTPPSGFLALCTKNLPDPTVIPSKHFNTVTYAGTGSSASIAGVGFQPDLVWIKRTNGVEDHRLTDVVRGVNLTLRSNTYNPEYTGNDVTAFNSDGFTNGGDSDDSGETYVAWNWKAGGTAVLNENGTIDSQVSANQDAGFSIVKYIGEATSSTIGHGLASKPEIVIIKNYEYDGSGWTTNVGNIPAFSASADMTAFTSANNYIIGYNVGGTYWLNTLPDNSVFTVSNPHAVNRLNYEHIAYCFHSVDGYSKIGSYTGNGSTGGTFVYTGFRPKYVMIKNATSVGHWQIHDTTRDTYNVMDNQLHINTNDADATSSAYYIDCLSNGFKLRMTHAGQNANGSKYLFYAIAEHPFKHTNAR
jgi:hypothetical protein